MNKDKNVIRHCRNSDGQCPRTAVQTTSMLSGPKADGLIGFFSAFPHKISLKNQNTSSSMSIAIVAPTSRELRPTSRVFTAMPSGGACTRDGYAGQMVVSLNALREQDSCRMTDLAVKE